MYHEGQEAKHVYLICEGEFLLTKRVPVHEEQNYKLDKLIGPNQTAFQEHLKPEDLKVVKSSVADLGPMSAISINPQPGKTGIQSLAKTKMHGAFKLIQLASG